MLNRHLRGKGTINRINRINSRIHTYKFDDYLYYILDTFYNCLFIMSEEEVVPENTCETIQITPDILKLFVTLEHDYYRIKEEIKREIVAEMEIKGETYLNPNPKK